MLDFLFEEFFQSLIWNFPAFLCVFDGFSDGVDEIIFSETAFALLAV